MAIYRQIYSSFWSDLKIEEDFTPEDKLFYLFLLTNPHTNASGCYQIGKKQMSKSTGYSEETVANLIYRMDKVHQVIKYCADTKEILLLNWHKHNWTKSSDFLRRVEKELSDIKHEPFRNYVIKNLEATGYEVTASFDDEEDPLVDPLVDGLVSAEVDGGETTVSVSVDNNNINNNYINNINTNNSTTEESDTKKKITKKKVYIEDFEKFWGAYPRKEGKGYAFECFKKARKESNVDVETMIEAVNLYKQTEQWQEQNGKYIPQPSTWLNQKRWEDSPQVKNNNGNESDADNKWARAAKAVRERSGLL